MVAIPATSFSAATPALTSSRMTIDRPVVPYIIAAWIRVSIDPPRFSVRPASAPACVPRFPVPFVLLIGAPPRRGK